MAFGSFQKFHTWLSSQLGMTLIWAEQNAPRPAKPYATLKVLSYVPQEHAAYGVLDENFQQQVYSHDSATFSIQIFGESNDLPYYALEQARLLKQKFQKLAAIFELQEFGWSFLRFLSGPNNVTTQIGSRFEPRANLDVELRTCDSFVDDLGYVESIILSGRLDKEEGAATDTSQLKKISVETEIKTTTASDTSTKKIVDIFISKNIPAATIEDLPFDGPYQNQLLELDDGDTLVTNTNDDLVVELFTYEDI